jgi:hypothetical protein
MRFSIAAAVLALALGFGPIALAGETGWANASNGYGHYHQSNGD